MAWELDTHHSLLEFSAKHMMVTTVKGRFKTFSAEVSLDERQPTASSAEVTIDIDSLDTGDPNRDGHLRSADFFDVAQFPTATFKTTKIERAGKDHYRVLGDLTIRGVTHEVPLDVTVEGTFTNMQGRRGVAFTAHSTFSRKDFNLNWNVALETGGWLVSDKVNIAIEAQVLESAPVTEEATAAAQ